MDVKITTETSTAGITEWQARPKYSIIIPSHNGADRIERALQSVLCQSVQDWELIVVCDKCTDGTEAVASLHGAKTVVIDAERFGFAENAGLDIAQGDWVLFMDDDDWWLHNRVIEVIDGQIGDDVDILHFGFVWKGIGNTFQDVRTKYCAPWNRCWRRSFIGDTRFSDKLYGADADFYEAVMRKAPREKYLHDLLYYYNYMRQGSLTERWKKHEIQ